MIFFDIILILLVILTGHFLARFYSNRFEDLSRRRLLQIFYYHLAFSVLYFIYISTFGGDSVGYWRFPYRFGFREGYSLLYLHEPGSSFIHFLTFPLAQMLRISLFTGSLIFSLFGYIGFIYLYLTLNRTFKSRVTWLGFDLKMLILFLPNMHFWSSGVGKDSIIFMALSLFIFSLTNPARNIPGMLISFYLTYFIRPHIALLVIVGLAFSLLTSSRGINIFWRAAFLAVSIYGFVVIAPSVLDFIGLEEDNLEKIDDLSDVRTKNLSRGSVASAIDISSYSIPQKILTFLFRPLFFDSGNIFGFVVSIENLFYILLFIRILHYKSILEILRMPGHLKASLLILGSTAYFMSSSLSNLGIIIRQKNMVMFMLVLICVYLISVRQASEMPVRQPLPNS